MSTHSKTPNLFMLSNEQVELTYTVADMRGQPQVSYSDGTHDVNARGPEVTRTETPVGTLVTVVVDATPDLGTLHLALLVPRVQLHGASCPIATVAILTTERTSIAGPGRVQGQVQSSVAISREGPAQLVHF